MERQNNQGRSISSHHSKTIRYYFKRIECIRDSEMKPCRKEYMKQYYQDNKEHLKQYKKQYYQDNKEHLKQYWKQYSEDNRELIKQKQKIKNILNRGFTREMIRVESDL